MGGRHMSETEHSEIWDRFEAGESFTNIGEAIGRNLTTVRSFVYRHNSRRPVPEAEPSTWSDHRLSLAEREEISRGLVQGQSVRSIAALIKRSPSTVSREINRNGGRDGYRASKAERATRQRAKRERSPMLACNRVLADLVAAKLEAFWSPEQIAGWLKRHHDPSMWVSHETIYQGVYDGLLRIDPKSCLRMKRVRRRRRYRRSNNGEGMLKDPVLISARPSVIETRTEFGHWEGDLVIGNHTTAIATLVERVSRYTILVPLPGRRTADALNAVLPQVFVGLPEDLAMSLTWDQGKEIAGHRALNGLTGLDIYVCNPHSPWQRGTNENTNGLIRQWFPKSTDFYTLDPDVLAVAQRQLNERPRQVLNWRTPAEVLETRQLT